MCGHWHGDAVVMRKLAGCCRGNGTTWRACWCLLGDAARSLSSLAVGQWKTPAYHNFDWLLALQQFPLPATHLPVHNKMSTDRLNDFLDFVIHRQLCSVWLLYSTKYSNNASIRWPTRCQIWQRCTFSANNTLNCKFLVSTHDDWNCKYYTNRDMYKSENYAL